MNYGSVASKLFTATEDHPVDCRYPLSPSEWSTEPLAD
jgi:hypothetical protein